MQLLERVAGGKKMLQRTCRTLGVGPLATTIKQMDVDLAATLSVKAHLFAKDYALVITEFGAWLLK